VTAPLPPADLDSRTPALVSLDVGETLHRFYAGAFEPIYFDRSTLGRFNAPDGRYGVLYCAAQAAGALAETFLRTPGRRLIDPALVATKGYCQLRATAPLKLIALMGPGLAIIGATAAIAHSGLPYDVPQIWSAALEGHPIDADGIAYRSRHDDDQICYALFDRARLRIDEVHRTTDLDTDWFWDLAETYRMGRPPV